MFQLLLWLKPCILIFLLCIFTTTVQCINELLIPLVMANIVDFGILSNNFTFILKNSFYMIILSIVSILFSLISAFFYTVVSTKSSFILRNKMFNFISTFSVNDYNRYGTTTLMNRIINDTMQIQQLLLKFLSIVIPSLVYFFCGLFIILYINIRIFTCLLFLILFIIILFLLISKSSEPLFKNIQNLLDNIGSLIKENIICSKMIRVFCTEKYHFQKFYNVDLELVKNIIKGNCLVSILIPIITIFVNIAIIFVFWICSFLIGFNQIKMGILLALTQYVSISLFSILSILDLIKIIPRSSASIKRLTEIEYIGLNSTERTNLISKTNKNI